MAQLVSYFEALNFIESKGYDIQPIEKENKMFKVGIWRGENYLGEGKIEYKTWQEATKKTTFDFYNKLNKKT